MKLGCLTAPADLAVKRKRKRKKNDDGEKTGSEKKNIRNWIAIVEQICKQHFYLVNSIAIISLIFRNHFAWFIRFSFFDFISLSQDFLAAKIFTYFQLSVFLLLLFELLNKLVWSVFGVLWNINHSDLCNAQNIFVEEQYLY